MSTEYPKIDGDVITILDDYSNTATGLELKLDFSEISIEQIKEEAKTCILGKYRDRAASPTYLRVLLTAVKKFSVFAERKGISTFADFKGGIPDEYFEYLNDDANMGGKVYSEKYKKYLWCVPGMIRNDLFDEE